MAQLTDEESFNELFTDITAADPLGFPEYQDKLLRSKERTGLNCAVLTGTATVTGLPCALAVFDFFFIGGTLGGAEGEKLCRLFEHACDSQLPIIVFLASGGMRMQEGLNSLMQMPKTVATLGRVIERKLRYLVVFTDPSYGGATASFASVPYGLKIAEPRARIGFAGPEVAKTIYPRDVEKLRHIQTPEAKIYPAEGMDTSQIDSIVPRANLKHFIASFLSGKGTA
ncbi:MAG: acetyl-CoA carboxylase carboxyl transferase subunit beta [Candidatus Berkelbacteria bacterium]|nr:MAG: acetyl-CoA carboxylase carboxyl transferase subunit beta [Candidatus Berkelbacteria bacterium]QQG51799.1 MAG: acetyl-CoA carboxylase carboxyl transferase subunit beta [Candidatus Berkelbacteria bacterium]